MAMLDRDIHLCRALVVDSNPTSRSILVAQLRDFGVGTVAQCGRIADARTQLEQQRFDVVLCEQGFSGTDYSGQQLLDDLRRHQLLPLSTVFVMITGEASYAQVAEAAESALDGYLLKPHTATALGERLMQARRRKKVLKDIFDAIEANRVDDAAALCRRRFDERAEFWSYAARIGAELLLGAGRPQQAAELYRAVLQTQSVPWARLGVARAQADANDGAAAVRTLEALIAEQPAFADAHDVMGRVQLELGRFEPALAACRQAVALTPGSVSRQQKLGMLAFHAGAHDEALQALERAVSLGISSKMFDCQTLVLLAFLRWRQRDGKGLQRCADNLAHALARNDGSLRLQRFVQIVQVLVLAHARAAQDGFDALRALAAAAGDDGFDIEAASNLLWLLADQAAAGPLPEPADRWVDLIGLRHCASKALTELLLRCAAAHAPFVERIQACHQRILQVSEASMAHTLAGDPAAAARGLLDHGRTTLNGKLIETAGLVLLRHQERIPDADRLLGELNTLRRRCASLPGRLALGDGSGRKAGGIALRAAAPEQAAA